MIQHEIDHLDGVLILDRTTRDQRKEAMRALREAERPPAAARCAGSRAHRLPRHVGVRRRRCSSAWPAAPHRPALVVTRPDRPRGRGRRLAAPPVAERARELGIELDQPESVNDDEGARGSPPPDRRRSACARSAR